MSSVQSVSQLSRITEKQEADFLQFKSWCSLSLCPVWPADDSPLQLRWRCWCWCHSCCVRSGISRLLLLSPPLCTIVLARAVNTLWRWWGTSTETRSTWRAPASSCRTQTPTEVSKWAVIVIREWQNNPLLVRASHPDLRQWGLLWHHPAAAQWRSRGLYLHQKWGVHNQHLQ